MTSRRIVSFSLVLLVTACSDPVETPEPVAERAVSAAGDLVTYTEEREVCLDRSPTRNAYFGDLHIHTAYSYDARPRGTETTPADAYRFAMGEAIPVPPYDEDGNPTATQQLRRPLDFAAVTDHSEFFGEMLLCFEPDSPVYDMSSCRLIRQGDDEAMAPLFRLVTRRDIPRVAEICGEDGALCDDAHRSLWQTIQDMAEAAYDRTSDCRFTSFIGYEYTGTPNANNIHRNVIFRNDKVPDTALSYVETPTDRDLWDQLTEQCLDGVEGCDVLAIPHNSNISAGAMFPSYVGRFDSDASARAAAELRNAMEPVMEVFQHKGNSECFNGLPNILGAVDELCETEQIIELGKEFDVRGRSGTVRFCEDGEIGEYGFVRNGCISKNDFYRSVLLTGLQDEAAIGVNSYKLGVIGSTDNHISLPVPGHTHEHGWIGALVREVDLIGRLTKIDYFPQSLDANPGGLAGVWAVENSRDAIFDALERREVFGTTGTRIRPRLFGGWDYSPDACSLDDMEARGYASGTPMGGDLPARPGDGAPRFLAAAFGDTESAPLQKLQVIKGWIDDDGHSNYKVFDVSGDHDAGGEIDLKTGEWHGPGDENLCTVFEDPEFDAAQAAYYYLRAVEVPTLRWSWHACVTLPADERPAECTNDAPKTIQEMAWTSPIWYLPPEQT